MQELGRGLKSPSDLAKLSRELLKITVEASLSAEMDDSIGYEKYSPGGYNTGNCRNGYNRKTLKGEHGTIEIAMSRERNGSFGPVSVAKNQTRLTKFDDQIPLFILYEKLTVASQTSTQKNPIQPTSHRPLHTTESTWKIKHKT